MISATSRYSQSTVVPLPNQDGRIVQTIVAGVQRPFTISFTWYQVPMGQRIDQIAFNAYGDGTLWWVIADANPEILDWSVLATGALIRIPSP